MVWDRQNKARTYGDEGAEFAERFLANEPSRRKQLLAAGSVLEMVLFVSGARRLLFLGSGCGYGAALMGRAVQEVGGWVLAVEADKEAASLADAGFAGAGLDKTVRQITDGPRRALAGLRTDNVDLAVYDGTRAGRLDAETLAAVLQAVRVGGLVLCFPASDDAEDAWQQAEPDLVADGLDVDVLHVPWQTGLLIVKKPEPPGGVLSHEYLD